jgi:hypothetical protein
MRFIPLVIVTVLGGSFEPEAALRDMIAKVKETESSFREKSLMIDHTLKQVIEKKSDPHQPSLIQVKSAAALASEMKAFETRKAALLEKDDKLVREKKAAFDKAMEKLSKDTTVLLRHKKRSSSFLQFQKRNVEDKNQIDKFFEAPFKQIKRIHKVVNEIAHENTKSDDDESIQGLDVSID